MSYVPYTPDVCPPLDAPPPSRAHRVFFWTAGTLLYLALIATWVWWMKLPPPIQPPLAAIPVAGGTELRLVHVQEGADYRAYSTNTFDDRIRVDSPGYYGAQTNSRSGRGAWLVYTHFNPRNEKFSLPWIKSFEISEPGNSTVYRGVMDPSPDRTFVHESVLFPVIPRRAPTLHAKIRFDSTTIETAIPNPVYRPNAPIWKGEPLPVSKVVDGTTITVERISFGKSRSSMNGQTTETLTASPSIKMTEPGVPKDAFSANYEWSDATGNVVSRGVLPFGESVWKLKVTVSESEKYPFPPKQVHLLGKVKVPGPGQVLTLVVPPELRKLGITDALVLGPGTYQRNGMAIMSNNGGGQIQVAKTSGYGPGSIGTLAGWEIHLYVRTYGGTREKRPVLRVHHAGGFVDARSTGSSSDGYTSKDTWGSFYSKGALVPAGDEIEIDMVVPKTRVAEFLIDRPEAPAGK